MKLKCVILDDEPLACECIEGYAAKVDFLEIKAVGANPVEVMSTLDRQKIDLLFLDIQMPVINGLDLIKALKDPPTVIITTAYPEFALEGFQLDVLDYLVKPITFERFFKAVNKAHDYHTLQGNAVNVPSVSAAEDYFFVKCTNKFERIHFNDILYIQGMQNYVTIFTTKGKYITHLTLKTVEDNLRTKDFIRVHKSYIVAISRIEAVENNDLIIHSARIPVSRNYRDGTMEIVVGSKLWKK
ncbi:MAG: LytTR family DNA-binding domain-containing protein [Bacteroidota bacterium]